MERSVLVLARTTAADPIVAMLRGTGYFPDAIDVANTTVDALQALRSRRAIPYRCFIAKLGVDASDHAWEAIKEARKYVGRVVGLSEWLRLVHCVLECMGVFSQVLRQPASLRAQTAPVRALPTLAAEISSRIALLLARSDTPHARRALLLALRLRAGAPSKRLLFCSRGRRAQAPRCVGTHSSSGCQW
jgi:hypothetical protein